MHPTLFAPIKVIILHTELPKELAQKTRNNFI